jgi:hypothetical protein
LRPADGFEADTCYLMVRGATDLEEALDAEEIEYWPRTSQRS